MNFKRLKFVLLVAVSLSCVLMLSGCSTTVYGEKLEGVATVFTPVVAIFKWFFNVFTPGMWAFVPSLAKLPGAISWVVYALGCTLAAVFYVVALFIVLVILLVLVIVLSLVCVIVAILNGFFGWF